MGCGTSAWWDLCSRSIGGHVPYPTGGPMTTGSVLWSSVRPYGGSQLVPTSSNTTRQLTHKSYHQYVACMPTIFSPARSRPRFLWNRISLIQGIRINWKYFPWLQSPPTLHMLRNFVSRWKAVTKILNCMGKIEESRAFPLWSLIHGSSWSGLIIADPGS